MEDKPVLRPAQGPRVAVAQIAPALCDLDANIVKHREAVERAREEKADVLVFPELSLTGYRLKDSVPDVAMGRRHPMMDELCELSTGISLLVGLVAETREHHFFNAAVYLEDGAIRHTHRKVYLPTYGMFDEQRYFARGRRIIAFDTKHGRMAVLICEDMLHPTAVTIAALDGASTILVPSASPVRGVVGDGEVDANGRQWEAYNRTMARALGLFVVYANRTGVEDGQTFWGGSEIVGPDGSSLAKASYYEPDFISAVIADEALRRKRIQAPVLRDEDVDLTINELARIRGRAADRHEPDRAGGRAPDRRPDRDRQTQGRGSYSRDDRDDRDRRGPRPGGDRRGGDRDSRGGGPPRRDAPREDFDRRRGDDRGRYQGRDTRDDRRRGDDRGRHDNRGSRDDRGRYDSRGPRDDRRRSDDRSPRDDRGRGDDRGRYDNRGARDDRRRGDDRGRYDNRGPRDDRRRGDDRDRRDDRGPRDDRQAADNPDRERPRRTERKPRPASTGFISESKPRSGEGEGES